VGGKNDKRLVYSSEGGRLCPECGKATDACTCRRKGPAAGAGPVRVRLDTKGRRGKAVTMVTGVPLGAEELADLGKKLKQKCGAGGTVKDGVIEIQGDHRATVTAALQAAGYKPRG
jgi:translation initiation factor 1